MLQNQKVRATVTPCYHSQLGLIVLKSNVESTHSRHGNGFAPVGEAVFRSSAAQHVCITGHGRRG
ncbi:MULTISPECIES: hypothetical protein [Gluconobacter]|uniref:hypothetical protein n=1 Tax=Gluconobacter TaxID=441 RepID=UPI000A3D1CDF|nr:MULTISPECIES: hypothetical protein [Gluconobacter]MBS1025000.1 hypothetical protein [Gluconobacter cerinus]MBS1037030.1 hypothetical protein [Gluconobacter cerinus]MBS1043769.1 hypothetical protein [Gluconobacter cerinus]MCW2266349.1 hypothetical protein [Gluconobacter cerinus]